MPSFQDAIENKLITDEQLWRVAQYVHSLSPEKAPEPREVVRAARSARRYRRRPTPPPGRTSSDSGCRSLGRSSPSHAGSRRRSTASGCRRCTTARTLSLRVVWDDPSKSPDPVWDEWLGRMSKTLTDVDGPLATQQGPDRLVVQWAQNPNDESKRPYFLGGDAKMPVYAWRWTSEPRVEEGTETGHRQVHRAA